MYYNTVSLFGDELTAVKQQAQSQDEMVFAVFEKLRIPLSPSLVYRYLINSGKISAKTPITSIRRSINSLTGDRKLEKTEKKVMGIFGAKEFQWKIK